MKKTQYDIKLWGRVNRAKDVKYMDSKLSVVYVLIKCTITLGFSLN